MDIVLSSDTGGVFSVFGWGFIAGAMFVTIVTLVFDWINTRTKNYKVELARIEHPADFQS